MSQTRKNTPATTTRSQGQAGHDQDRDLVAEERQDRGQSQPTDDRVEDVESDVQEDADGLWDERPEVRLPG